jgi:peroxiredoxin
LVAISVDSVSSHLAFARNHQLQFPLLSDFEPKGAVARAYGVYQETEGRSGQALFVLDDAGVIRWSGAYPIHLNPGVDGVLTALETLRAEERP